MMSSTADRLREEWGNADCYHPMLDNEFSQEGSTGNLVCLTCGSQFNQKKLIHSFLFLFFLINLSESESEVVGTLKILASFLNF